MTARSSRKSWSIWGTSYGQRDTYQWDPANPQAPQLWSGGPRNFTLGAGNTAPHDSPPGWYWQSGIEMVAIMLAYCDYSGDTAFRDQKLLPFAQEILRFYDVHWPRNAQGKIHLFPLSSIEAIQNATNPMPDVAGLHFVLPQLIACTSDEKQKTAWRKMLADLPPLPIGAVKRANRACSPRNKANATPVMKTPNSMPSGPTRSTASASWTSPPPKTPGRSAVTRLTPAGARTPSTPPCLA